MFQIGDQVIYGIHGVCCIVDREQRVIDRKRVEYLVLEPVGHEGSRYLVPTQNPSTMSKLCRMLTKEELEALLQSETVHTNVWIKDENQRKQRYRELIGCADREALLSMVHSLYLHKQAQSAAGRKIHQCDENFLRDAERILSGEIGIVFSLDPDQARSYLHERLNVKE